VSVHNVRLLRNGHQKMLISTIYIGMSIFLICATDIASHWLADGAAQ
jgi:hypothetical protein